MRLAKFLIPPLIFILIGCMLAVTGCGNRGTVVEPEGKPESKYITITDCTGRNIEVPQPLERVVVFNSWVAEAFRILDVQDKVIGVDEGVQKHPYLNMQDKDIAGGTSQPNHERIVELKPQVVFCISGTGSARTGKELADKLEPLGIKTVILDFHKPDEYNDDLKILATMFGEEKKAGDFITWKTAQEKKLADRLKGFKQEERKKVFQIWESGIPKNEWGTSSKGDKIGGTGPDQEINLAGGINIAKDLAEAYPVVSGEWVLQQNPDTVLISTSKVLGYTTADYNDASELRDLVLKNKVFANLDFVENEQVFVIRGYGNNPYINAQFLAKWLYPERFEDVDPEEALQEYFERWLDVPFQGKWAYPLMSN